MSYYFVQTLNALSFSVLLLLTGLGLSLVLSLMNFINLAHGAFFLLGGYIGIHWLAAGARGGSRCPPPSGSRRSSG
ncbi:hypothetical protein [Verticiella alkaliphila]|uniref:hypothetical protein n=1 Tax=Verticiella alkaliphila TaxID=2779529 RepID=UPI001C0CD38E|nr:hypothetical protein [Verticiella sp. GG226]